MRMFKIRKWATVHTNSPQRNNKKFLIMSEIKKSNPVLKTNGVKKDFRLIINHLQS